MDGSFFASHLRMWQYIVSNSFPLHYLWLSALFTQFLVVTCFKKSKQKNNVPFRKGATQENIGGSKEVSNASSDASKESKEPRLQLDKEAKIGRNQDSLKKIGKDAEPVVFNMESVRRRIEENRSIVKTDLGSVEDMKFDQYDTRKKVSNVKTIKRTTKLAEEQRTQLMPADPPEDRELTLLTPHTSTSSIPPPSPFQTLSIYDPLSNEQKAKPVEKPVA